MSEKDARGSGQVARKLVVDLSIMTVIGVVLALIGPFGSFAEPLPYRLVSWVSFAWIGYAIYSPMSYLVDRLYVWLDLPRSMLWLLSVAFATLPMTAIVWAMNFLPRPVPWPTLEQALSSYFYVFLVGGAITAFFYAIETRTQAAEAPVDERPLAEPGEVSDAELPFIDRIPNHLGTDLIALEMEDHYVRVHTAAGSDLVLMRMRDAVAELGDLEGEQVHRSWWVARSSVEGSRREGRNVRLQLSGGLEAPVSRNMAPQLKQLGWF